MNTRHKTPSDSPLSTVATVTRYAVRDELGRIVRWAGSRPIPHVLTASDVPEVYTWPIRASHADKARQENWTDCIIHLHPDIKLGCRYNHRRVRSDYYGLYVTWRKRRVRFVGELLERVADHVTTTYGTRHEPVYNPTSNP